GDRSRVEPGALFQVVDVEQAVLRSASHDALTCLGRDENRSRSEIPVVKIGGHERVVASIGASLRVEHQYGIGVQVRARSYSRREVGTGIADWHVEQSTVRIERIGGP